jgi:hypothetical protein
MVDTLTRRGQGPQVLLNERADVLADVERTVQRVVVRRRRRTGCGITELITRVKPDLPRNVKPQLDIGGISRRVTQ